MIRFFRTIRQNLLSKGKTGKYLKYAIGEIILVVIGILIALQINNWNTKRTELDNEKILLIVLREELVNNIEVIIDRLDYTEKASSQYHTFLDSIELNTTMKMDAKLASLFHLPILPIETPVLNKIIELGELKSFPNNQFIYNINDLKQSHLIYEKLQYYIDEMRTETIMGFLTKTGLGIFISDNNSKFSEEIVIDKTFLSVLVLQNEQLDWYIEHEKDLLDDMIFVFEDLKDIDDN